MRSTDNYESSLQLALKHNNGYQIDLCEVPAHPRVIVSYSEEATTSKLGAFDKTEPGDATL